MKYVSELGRVRDVGLGIVAVLAPLLALLLSLHGRVDLGRVEAVLGLFRQGPHVDGQREGNGAPFAPASAAVGGQPQRRGRRFVLVTRHLGSLMHSCGNRAPLTRAVWVDDAVVGLRVVATVPVEDGDGGEDEERKKEALTTAAMRRVLLCLSL